MTWEEFYKLNKIGIRFQDASIDHLAEKLDPYLVEEAKKWCKQPTSLILTGNTGTGKTYFSFALVREAIRSCGLGQIRWVTSKHLDEELTQAHSKFGDTSATIEKFSEVPILFIDDFGVDRGTEKAERDYYQIIDNRWSHNRLTCISTNLEPAIIKKLYGDRIHSRFKDFRWINFMDKDLRGADQDKRF